MKIEKKDEKNFESKQDIESKTVTEAPDLKEATQEWMTKEKKQKRKLIMVIAGSITALLIISFVWFRFVSIDKLPVGCEAAITKVSEHCGISRRETIARIKSRPSLVEEEDKNRRETCRVLASPDHEFWRQRSIRKVLQLRQSGKTSTGEQNLEADETKGKDPLSGPKIKIEGRKDPIPIPSTIRQSGPLSDTSRQFILLVVMPEFIQEHYCRKNTPGSE